MEARMRIRLLGTSIFVLWLLTLATAQQPRGANPNPNDPFNSPNDTELRVRISWGNGKTVTEPIHLQLINLGGIPIQQTFTNPDGTASFYGVKAGHYQIKADGSGIVEVTTPRIMVMTGENTKTEFIQVTAKDPNQAVGGLPGKPVSVQEVAVPERARKEMERGME